MLVDSSVWIAFLRGDDGEEVDLLVKALDRTQSVWLAPPILQEVLQGADRPERAWKWDGILRALPMSVEPDARATARAAPELYARRRCARTTPRHANDSLLTADPPASRAGVQPFASASAFTVPTSARLRAKFSPWKRGLVRR